MRQSVCKDTCDKKFLDSCVCNSFSQASYKPHKSGNYRNCPYLEILISVNLAKLLFLKFSVIKKNFRLFTFVNTFFMCVHYGLTKISGILKYPFVS